MHFPSGESMLYSTCLVAIRRKCQTERIQGLAEGPPIVSHGLITGRTERPHPRSIGTSHASLVVSYVLLYTVHPSMQYHHR